MSDQYYETYWKRGKDWSPSSGSITKIEGGLFSKYITPGKNVLDFGCGDGRRYGKYLTDAGTNYVGYDISTEAVTQAKLSDLNVKLFGINGTLDEPESSKDVIICFEVLEHLLEPGKALNEIRRVLRPGGVLLTSVPNSAYFSQRIEFLLTGFFNPGGSPLTARKTPWEDPHIRFFNPRLFMRMAEFHNLKVKEMKYDAFTLGSLPYIYRKPKLQKILQMTTTPVSWLSSLFPGPFSSRIFLVGQKPLN